MHFCNRVGWTFYETGGERIADGGRIKSVAGGAGAGEED